MAYSFPVSDIHSESMWFHHAESVDPENRNSTAGVVVRKSPLFLVTDQTSIISIKPFE